MFPNPSRPSVMKHDFSMVPKADIPRSQFNRSHGYKTALAMAGVLYPFFCDEVLPGDTMNLKPTIFARLSTPILPFLDNLYLSTFWFFCPMRLIWTNYDKFFGAQANPGDSVSYNMPQFTAYNCVAESLSDYFGIPPLAGGATKAHVSLPHRAYNKIWNDWFRCEYLQDSVTVDLGDGPDSISNYVLKQRGKAKDYFTSGLPWTQKFTAQSVPLTGTAPVKGIAIDQTAAYASTPTTVRDYTGSVPTGNNWSSAGGGPLNISVAGSGTSPNAYPQIYADLSSATAVTINALRQSFQIQKMYERDARGGTRYVETILSHFGVRGDDLRLNRPQYLGGGKAPIMINPVAATAFTSGANALGRLAGAGYVTHHGMGFVQSFTEHGYIIGLVCIDADLTYQQGLDRMWSRSTRADLYWPVLAHLGEQSILNQEIYLQGSANPTQDAATFAYQERYAEYRYKNSMITGKMRSTYSAPLDQWHLAQKFTSLPTLGDTFIKSMPPVDRVVAVNTEPQLFLDAYFDYRCTRPMPVYSVPGLVDHF